MTAKTDDCTLGYVHYVCNKDNNKKRLPFEINNSIQLYYFGPSVRNAFLGFKILSVSGPRTTDYQNQLIPIDLNTALI